MLPLLIPFQQQGFARLPLRATMSWLIRQTSCKGLGSVEVGVCRMAAHPTTEHLLVRAVRAIHMVARLTVVAATPTFGGVPLMRIVTRMSSIDALSRLIPIKPARLFPIYYGIWGRKANGFNKLDTGTSNERRREDKAAARARVSGNFPAIIPC